MSKGRRAAQSDLPIYLILVGMGALVVVALLVLPGLQSGGEVVVPTPVARPPSADNSLGDPAAPVHMDEFSDFQCPFCARFTWEVEEQLVSEYVSTGSVYFRYRHFVVIGPPSELAAEASLCAMEQGAFWPYHDILFANQDETNPESFSFPRLLRFAQELGLEESPFRECLDAGRFETVVQQDKAAGLALGVDRTPSFSVNGVVLVGLQPYEVFAEAIERALAAQP
jgi:protein-disulfide isomerase